MDRSSGRSRVWPTSGNLWHTSGERPWRGSFRRYLGQEGSREHVLFTWFVDKLVRKVKGCTSESFLELPQRGLRTGGEIWPGQGAGRGWRRRAWRVGRGRTEPREAAREPPSSPPSWRGSELWLRHCFASAGTVWLEGLFDRATAAALHVTQGLHKVAGGTRGALLSPCERLGPGTPPDVPSSLQDICVPLYCFSYPSNLILLHPGPHPAQDRTFVPSGHPRNPFSGCDNTTPFSYIWASVPTG